MGHIQDLSLETINFALEAMSAASDGSVSGSASDGFSNSLQTTITAANPEAAPVQIYADIAIDFSRTSGVSGSGAGTVSIRRPSGEVLNSTGITLTGVSGSTRRSLSFIDGAAGVNQDYVLHMQLQTSIGGGGACTVNGVAKGAVVWALK